MRAADQRDVDLAGGQITGAQRARDMLGRPGVGIHQCQTLQSVAAHSPRTGAEPSPAGDPDRNARLLNAGRCGHPSASARDGFACEHLLEQADPGIESGGSSAVVDRRFVEHRVLAVAVDPKAEAQHHPATGQAIDRCRRLSDELRPTSRQGGDHRADHHPLGRHRDRRQRDEWVGERNQRSVPEMVPDEHAVPTGPLSADRHFREQSRVGQVPGQRDRQAPPHARTVPSVSPSPSAPGGTRDHSVITTRALQTNRSAAQLTRRSGQLQIG